ncbi:hypothetical protein FQN52_008732 [Onygenales sp. PD_12]|nr:hypothetical protein FQN52_008732 [Onygenales sp. PD_12]
MPGSFPDDSIDAIEPDTVQPVEKNVSFQAPFEVDPKLAKSRKRSRSSPGTLRERKTWPISILPRYEVSHQRQEKKNSQKSNNIIIAVFGQTGSGKSSFISKLTGLPVEIGHGLQSCTSAIEEIDCKIGPYNVTFVDTPGFDDTDMNDTEILQMIATWMKDSYDDNTRLTGVIYLHRITDVRMSGTSVKNIRMLRSLCGTKSLDHVILTTGRWDEVDYYDGVRREGELLTEGKFWGDLVQHGAMVRRYNNTQSGAQAIVDQLLCLSPTVLKIQDEFAVKKKALIDTEAGQSISEALKELTRKHDKELARMKEDLATAMKESMLCPPPTFGWFSLRLHP